MKVFLLATLMALNCFADVTFEWGINSSLYQYKIQAEKFKKQIEHETKGEIKVKIVYFDVDPTDPLKNIKEEDIDLYQVKTDELQKITTKYHPFLDTWNIPHVFKTPQHVEKYIESSRSRKNLASLETDKYQALTYSYAGGFVSILSHSPVSSKENLNQINDFCPLTELSSSQDKRKEVFVKEFTTRLPCLGLLYELNELSLFSDALDRSLVVNLTHHKVISRISILSKSFLSKLKPKTRQIFLKRLNEILIEERAIVNKRGLKNITNLKATPNLKVHTLSNSERKVPELKKKQRKVAEEIMFIQRLLEPELLKQASAN